MEAEMLWANHAEAGAAVPISVPASRSRSNRIALALILSAVLGLLPVSGHTAGLDCPEIGRSAASDLLPDSLKLVSSVDTHELTNEIRYVVYQLRLEHPDISYTELTDVLIAAYCPVVANLRNLTASEKWQRMRQFDTILQQQLAGNMLPPGSLIVASVPLPPTVYRELRAQAASVGQTASQLMAAILSRAAGN
jgi:hypothetical protein